MSHLLLKSVSTSFSYAVELAKGNLPLPLPKLNTLGQVLGLLKGVKVLGCWSMSVSWSEVMSTTTGLPLAWLSLPSSESLQSDLTFIFLCVCYSGPFLNLFLHFSNHYGNTVISGSMSVLSYCQNLVFYAYLLVEPYVCLLIW